jgi:hypothetical protein
MVLPGARSRAPEWRLVAAAAISLSRARGRNGKRPQLLIARMGWRVKFGRWSCDEHLCPSSARMSAHCQSPSTPAPSQSGRTQGITNGMPLSTGTAVSGVPIPQRRGRNTEHKTKALASVITYAISIAKKTETHSPRPVLSTLAPLFVRLVRAARSSMARLQINLQLHELRAQPHFFQMWLFDTPYAGSCPGKSPWVDDEPSRAELWQATTVLHVLGSF